MTLLFAISLRLVLHHDTAFMFDWGLDVRNVLLPCTTHSEFVWEVAVLIRSQQTVMFVKNYELNSPSHPLCDGGVPFHPPPHHHHHHHSTSFPMQTPVFLGMLLAWTESLCTFSTERDERGWGWEKRVPNCVIQSFWMFLCVCFSPMTSRAHIQPGKAAPGMQRGENAGPQSEVWIQRSLGPGPRHSLRPGLGLLAPDAQHRPQPRPRGQDGAGGAGHGGRPGPPAHQGGSGQAHWGGRPAAFVHGRGLCRCQRCVAAALLSL